MTNVDQNFADIRESMNLLDCVDDNAVIKETAARLHKYNYQPPFVIDLPGFVDFKKKDALHALDKLHKLKTETIAETGAAKDRSPDEVKMMAMQMLLKEFRLLQNLRRDEPEAWDHINELYEDD